MSQQITNIAGYKFTPIHDTTKVFDNVHSSCGQTHIKGNIFISTEGINLGIASTQSDIEYFLTELARLCGIKDLFLNTTYSENTPFKRLLIKVRKELVPTKPIGCDETPNIDNKSNNTITKAQHLPVDELKDWLDQGKDITLLDMRNTFEIDLGSFDHSTHLEMRNFRDIIGLEDKINKLPKDKPIVTFCTGGIRCEKGAPILAEYGFKEVYQLKGGIIKYLEKYQNQHWHGECFVFDDRVCLDENLQATYTRLCRHCQIVLSNEEGEYCEDCAHLA